MQLLGASTDLNYRFPYPFLTSTSEIPTLSYTWSRKKVPFQVGATQGVPPGVLYLYWLLYWIQILIVFRFATGESKSSSSNTKQPPRGIQTSPSGTEIKLAFSVWKTDLNGTNWNVDFPRVEEFVPRTKTCSWRPNNRDLFRTSHCIWWLPLILISKPHG